MYDEDGNEYPTDSTGQLYVPLEFEQAMIGEDQEENCKRNKKLKRSYASVVSDSTT